MTAIRRHARNDDRFNDTRRFPPEAYECNDDVTEEAVEIMRKKAAPIIDAEEWETVDGFGRVVYA